MNWREINKKYPKSCYLLELYLGGHKEDDYSSHEFDYLISGLLYNDSYFEPQVLGLRSLYDFFDEHDIFIEVSLDRADSWFYDIFNEDMNCIAENSKYIKRIKAEEAAFLKAFEILEKKL